MTEITKVYLDNLCRRNIDEVDWIKRKFYSYKNETITLNDSDKKKFQELLRKSYKWKKVIFINAISIKNNYNGYQDVVIEFEHE